MQLHSDQLKGTNEAYYHIFDSVLYDGFCYCEKTNLRDFEFSKKLKTLLGFEETYNLTLSEIFQVDDLKPFLEILSTEDDSRKIAQSKELRIIAKSGEILWMRCQIYSQPTVELVFVGFKDIGNSNIAEKEAIIHYYKRNDEVLRAASVGTWQHHLATGKTTWSEYLSTIIGYTSDEFEESGCDLWSTLLSADEAEELRQLFHDHIDNSTLSFKKEIQLKHKNGHHIWVIIEGKVISFTDNEHPEWMGGILYDVTDRRSYELSNLKYENLMPQVHKAAQIGIWEVNLQTKEVYYSDELKKIFGVPLSFDPSFEYGIDFINEGENRQKMIASVRGAIDYGINYDIEVEATNRNNECVWIRAVGVTEFKDGKCLRYYGFLQDISERKFANRQLALKEELFRKTFLYAPSGMALITLDAKISLLNKNLCDFLGYTEDELLHNYLRKLSYPPDKYLTKSFINQLLAGSDETFKIDKRYLHKNGSIIWAQVSMSTIKDEFGQIINFVVQLQDINERKNAEFLLTNYKDLLERSNSVAKIGTWEIDVENYTVSWSDSLNIIVNTREGLIPKYDDSIKHLISEEHHDVITSAIKNSLESGTNFDLQLLANTVDGSIKWIRMIGIAEFENGEVGRLYGLMQDISDIKLAQQAIEIKEEQWRTTFEYSNAGIALINFDGVPYKVNKSVCEIFGYTIQEMQDIRIKDISLPEELDSNITQMNKLINGQTTNFCREMRFLHKQKHIVWTNVTVSAVRNDYNHFTHMVAQVIDITKSKTNELLLEKYKEILERSNEVAKIGSWEFDPTTLNLKLSKNLHTLVGKIEIASVYECEFIQDYILEDSQKYINALIIQAIKVGENFDVELEIKTAFGQRWMRLIAISDFENGSCNLLHGLVQDIHEIKSAQMEIQLREQEFRQSFLYASTGMALIDLKGKIVRANPSLCETLGYTMQELIEIDKVFLSDSNDAIVTATLIEQLVRGERESFEQEKRYYHKNQSIIWAILSMSTVKNDKGETTHYVALVTDITDKKLLTESLKEHNNRLQNYAHIVSHNLRSHTGNLMMLLELSEIDDEQKIDQELFEHIKSAATNMSETVSHLSEIVQIQNLIKNTLVPQNLRKRVKKALENVQATISHINGKVSISVKENLMVFAIPSYLDSIILNILTNAIKYRSNDRPLTIKIVAENKNGRTSLSFTDNGLGIDLEKYGSKIFGMYKTFHDHKDARGIGLFMTKNQLEAMGGGIEVQSKQNIGSTFKIYFRDENN